MLLRRGSGELGIEVAPQVLQAFRSHPRPLPGLGQDEGALDHCLHVEGETFCAPRRVGCIAASGFGDVLGHCRRVCADVPIARSAKRGVSVVSFLDHRAEQTGEIREGTLQDRDAEVDVAQQPIERVGGILIRRCCKHGVSHRREVSGCGKCQIFLALEVMEEAALGEAGCLADVFDARRAIALGANDVQRCIKESDLGCVR